MTSIDRVAIANTVLFFDTETTGLIDNEFLPLSQQPHIIEFGAVLLDVTSGAIVGEFSHLIKPPIALPTEIPKITGITDEMLKDELPFGFYFADIAQLFIGRRQAYGHNVGFDLRMLTFELRRIGKEYAFPYPIVLNDTKQVYSGHLEDWGKEIYGDKNFEQKHRAVEDARLNADLWWRSKGP